MIVPVLAFFNNQGGVGKTSLVFHLAHMYADLGMRILAADLDPQANLTAAMLEEDELERLWPESGERGTVFGGVEPLMRGLGDIRATAVRRVNDYLTLLAGDLSLAQYEDELSGAWPRCVDGQERAFRVESAFWRLLQQAARANEARLILIDVGPNLGAINRAALISSDYVIVPLTPDLFSLQGLRNVGPALRRWRREWADRRERNPEGGLPLPAGKMQPIGYVLQQHSVRLDRPLKAYDQWIERVPLEYRRSVLGEDTPAAPDGADPECLAQLRHYRSLMPMAYEARKPMFALKPADGAIGAHSKAVASARQDFERLAGAILERIPTP